MRAFQPKQQYVRDLYFVEKQIVMQYFFISHRIHVIRFSSVRNIAQSCISQGERPSLQHRQELNDIWAQEIRTEAEILFEKMWSVHVAVFL